MKTILSLLLLPIMVLAQPRGKHQKEHFNLEFSMGIDMGSIIKNEIDIPERMNGITELSITAEIYLEELEIDHMIPQFTDFETVVNAIPKHLNTFSLVDLYPNANEAQRPQEWLDRMLALNDPMFAKENTLMKWLNPVRYQKDRLDSIENMPEGFGPRIRLGS